MAKKSFRSLLEKARKRDAYWVGKAIHDFTEDLFRLMEEQGVNKAELARRIGKTPAYVTKVFRGDTNFTIDSMVKFAHALDGQLSIHVGRKEGQALGPPLSEQSTKRSENGLDSARGAIRRRHSR
jgi:transcriptional regulator with XRE-family HTH domain